MADSTPPSPADAVKPSSKKTLGILSPAEAATPFAWEKTTDKTYKITSSDKSLPGGTYTLSDDGKTLNSSTGLIVLNKA